MTGEIPKELGSLANLQGLYLWGNQLTGGIPTELGSLANLLVLDLGGNQLTGEIPKELGNLANLERLYLSENQLTGCIPYGLRHVVDNDFDELGLPFCADDDAVSCAAGGAVPDAAKNPELEADCDTLLTARDTLAGTASLNWAADTPITQWDGVTVGGTPKRVRVLSLEDGGLTGEIPTELGSLANLERLVLYNNQLTGEIPKELGNLANLESLSLWGNQLTGGIPKELGSLANLLGLDLSGNQLTGGIPTELGSLANLLGLFLSENQLTGCIPYGLRDVADNDLDELGLPFCDVLLSGLTVSPGSLLPQFDPYRTDYSASVGLSPVTVTVNPTNDHDATFLFFDENDIEVADADTTLEGFQVEFGAGVPAIKIRIVSQDSQATYTYIVTDLGNRYDANDDRVIQRDEVITAIKDYFSDLITREETIEVIKLYFSS